jgi:DNA-binding NarL/FixJ family response regulator
MRILLADDQPRVRFALRALLERRLGAAVVGEASDLDELRAQLPVCCPDVILLDWDLPGRQARAFVAGLREACPKVSVVALSGRVEARQAALAAGADAFVCKCDPPDGLISALQQIVDAWGGVEAGEGENKATTQQECGLGALAPEMEFGRNKR